MSWPVVVLIAFIAWAVGRAGERGRSNRVQVAVFQLMLSAFVAYLTEQKGETLSYDEFNDLTEFLTTAATGRES